MTEDKFQNLFDSLPTHGWLTEPEARLLISTAEGTTGDIIEIGSYQGRSSVLLASLGRRLFCIDSWEDEFSRPVPGDRIYQAFLDNVAHLPNIFPARKRVEDWIPFPVGFVYLDGDHTFEGTKVQCLKALACNPKAIAAHDVNDIGEGRAVKRAVLEILGAWDERVERLAVWRNLR